MKNGKITLEDIAQHIPEQYEGGPWSPIKTREDLIVELQKRINAANRIDAQAAIKPTILNRRSQLYQKYYAALSSLNFEQMQLYKEIFKDEKTLKTVEAKQTLVFSDKGLLKIPTPNPYTFGYQRNRGPWIPDREIIGPLLEIMKTYLYKDLL